MGASILACHLSFLAVGHITPQNGLWVPGRRMECGWNPSGPGWDADGTGIDFVYRVYDVRNVNNVSSECVHCTQSI